MKNIHNDLNFYATSIEESVAFLNSDLDQGLSEEKAKESPATSLLKLMNYCAGNPTSAGFDPTLTYSLKAQHNYYVMEVANGSLNNFAGVQQNPWIAGNKQRWSLTANNNEFKITNINSGKVLDEVNKTPNGNGVQYVQNLWHGGATKDINWCLMH